MASQIGEARLGIQSTVSGTQESSAPPETDRETAQQDTASPTGAAQLRHRFSQLAVYPAAAAAAPSVAIQAKAPSGWMPPRNIRQSAQWGTRGPGGPLPFLQQIQRSFGRHDVSKAVAHTDEAAATSASAMGAAAYTTGNHVAFAGPPSLRIAAHEAAHIVQQRGGVQLFAGVGQSGDSYERHADAVAECVVAGQSAEALLDGGAASPSAHASVSPPVQMWKIGSRDPNTFQGGVVEDHLSHLTPLELKMVADQKFKRGPAEKALANMGTIYLECKDSEVAAIVAQAQKLLDLAAEGATEEGLRHVDAPVDETGAGALATALGSATAVKLTQAGVDVYLDNDQLKHQPQSFPIGNRNVKKGNQFKPPAGSQAWHLANTLPHMAQWAASLGAMSGGQRIFHGQSVPVNGVHYEGFCLFANGAKHVFFHCYPADNSSDKL